MVYNFGAYDKEFTSRASPSFYVPLFGDIGRNHPPRILTNRTSMYVLINKCIYIASMTVMDKHISTPLCCLTSQSEYLPITHVTKLLTIDYCLKKN